MTSRAIGLSLHPIGGNNWANQIGDHLGCEITVGAHYYGRVVDDTRGLREGPMTPKRAGDLPNLGLVD